MIYDKVACTRKKIIKEAAKKKKFFFHQESFAKKNIQLSSNKKVLADLGVLLTQVPHLLIGQ